MDLYLSLSLSLSCFAPSPLCDGWDNEEEAAAAAGEWMERETETGSSAALRPKQKTSPPPATEWVGGFTILQRRSEVGHPNPTCARSFSSDKILVIFF
jgi:hypothetical protein